MAQDSTLPTLVTGSGGTLGSCVVQELAALGREVRGVGRKIAPLGFVGEWKRCDLRDGGSSLEEAVSGIDTIVHCASDVKTPKTDVLVLNNLIRVVRHRDVRLVYVSIAGIDRAAQVFEYYRVKLECERLLRESGTRHLVVRISQFHPFVEMLLSKLSIGPLIMRPKMTLQPVDIDFAAKELARTVIDPFKASTIIVHGPERLTSDRLIAAWTNVRGKKKLVVPFPAVGPLKPFSLIDPVTGYSGGLTWAQWLQQSAGKRNPYINPADK